MKLPILTTMLLTACAITYPLGKQTENNKNIYGTFEFRDGNIYEVEKIIINGYDTSFKCYTKPANTKNLEVNKHVGSGNIERTEIFLKHDPLVVEHGPIDLISIKEIKVPHPHTDWVYQEYPKDRATKYTEIVIDGKPRLIAKHTKIKGVNRKNKDEKIKIKKISRAKKITIKGYSIDVNQQKNGQST